MTEASPRLSTVPQPAASQRPAPVGLVWLRALRPRQWTKNLLLFAPLLFAKAALSAEPALDATLAVAAFCFLASAVYVLNDWLDREADRLHPEKKLRPIAAGLLKGPAALALGASCLAAGFGLALRVGASFTTFAVAYLALQLAYSFALKRLVIVDVMAIAAGFVLRVMAGGAAIGVPISNWLLLCTLLGAVFLGFAKRRHEVALLSSEASAHRQNLQDYSVPLLDQMMAMVSAACIVAYGLYTVASDTVAHVGSDGLKYTVPFVLYGIFRYMFLVHRKGEGGSPERVLLTDVPLLVDLALYLGVAAWVLYGGL